MSKKFPELTEQLVWENDEVKLVKLHGLKTGPGHYQVIPGRKIHAVIIHHADSNPLLGQAAPRGIANFHASPPKYKTDAQGNVMYRKVGGKPRKWWIGGGRGWPGIGYQYVVPTIPDIEEGKAVVYQAWDDDVWSWHTDKAINRHGLGVCMAGCFRSEHYPNNPLAQSAPDPSAWNAMEQLVLGYLLPHHGLTAEDGLYGHFDYGKPACPGDWLEQWVRHQRGESVPHPKDEYLDDPDPEDQGKTSKPTTEFASVASRQQALIDLGYDLGKWGADGKWGNASKGALLAFQDSSNLVVDGVWGPKTEQAIKKALEAKKHED